MHPARGTAQPVIHNPFLLGEEALYRAWKQRKLQGFPQSAAELFVAIDDPHALTQTEYLAMVDRLRRTNMVIYGCATPSADKTQVAALGRRFGLQRLDDNLCADEDSITSLTVVEGGRHKGYIPYSNRPLNWHTDGYYNSESEQIRGVILHCVQDAASGGDNGLLDHEIAYLLMREQEPAMVAAFMAKDAMTIPPNVEGGEAIRDAQSGPVFSIDDHGNLHMRYTARKRNIEWKQDVATLEAVAFMEELLNSNNPYIFHNHLQPGQGLICNNVLHSRSGFTDDDTAGVKRLLYRARYFDRVADTNVTV